MDRERVQFLRSRVSARGASRRLLLGSALYVVALAAWFLLPGVRSGLGASAGIIEIGFVSVVFVPIGALVLGGNSSQPGRRNVMTGLVVAVVCAGFPLILALVHPQAVEVWSGETLSGPDVAVVALLVFALMFTIGVAASGDGSRHP